MRVRGIVSAIALLTLSACVSSSGGPGDNPGDSNQITVGTWGGDFGEFQVASVIPVVEEEHPNLQVTFSYAGGEDRLAKLRAEAGAEEGTMDVVGLTRDRSEVMVNAGLLKKLDMSKIPNAKYIKDDLRNDYCVPHITSTVAILYDKDKVKPAPTSYEVFWNEEYRGRIGFYTKSNWKHILYAAAAYAQGGDPNGNWEPGWPLIEQMKQGMDPVSFGSNEQLGQALMKGQTWLTISQKARAVMWNESEAVDMGAVVAEETGYRYISCAAIPKNAPNPDDAYKYINAMLDPRPQTYYAEHMGYEPTVTNANLDPELKDAVGSEEAFADGRVTIEHYGYVAKNYSEWTQKFMKIFL